jgi:uncharacterized protein (TIGR02246 family)
MRTATIGTAVALVACAAATAVMAQKVAPPARTAAATKTDAKSAPRDAAREADEKAIRLVADAFAKAYNAHDAKAVANLFTADAQLVDEEGDVVQGRAEIARVFSGIVAEYPQAKITVAIKAIRFVGPGVAVEDGSTTVVNRPNEPGELSRYTVVHVKQEGKWLMASARDLPADSAAAEEQLKQLQWLVGEWVDESPDSLVMTAYRWDDKHRYLLSDFTIQVGGRPVMNGTQRLGWDPLAKVIRSWTFDSEGGFAEGVYTRDGNQWIVKTTGVTHDGKAASATNITTRIGKDRMTWQSRDRIVGGEAVADIEEVTVVRKPPKPM